MKPIAKRNGESAVDWKRRIAEQKKKAEERKARKKIEQAGPQLFKACEKAKTRLKEERGTMIIADREIVIDLLVVAIAAAKGMK